MSNSAKKFLLAIAERALKTFAQTFVAVVGVGSVLHTDSTINALQVAASAAVLSVLTSLASAQFGPHGPSLASESISVDEVAGH